MDLGKVLDSHRRAAGGVGSLVDGSRPERTWTGRRPDRGPEVLQDVRASMGGKSLSECERPAAPVPMRDRNRVWSADDEKFGRGVNAAAEDELRKRSGRADRDLADLVKKADDPRAVREALRGMQAPEVEQALLATITSSSRPSARCVIARVRMRTRCAGTSRSGPSTTTIRVSASFVRVRSGGC